MTLPDDDEQIDELIERAIDAQDATADRLWRHRLRGNTIGMVVGAAGGTRSIQLKIPPDELRSVKACAASRGLTPIGYVRMCVATSMVEEHGIDPATIPWLTREGLLP
ncbi:MAG TPA: hypothetical protein VFK70_00985 [Vicinamibacteria bacterium]|nr:hypothetical protein [Vicinamibacteria bacterium]